MTESEADDRTSAPPRALVLIDDLILGSRVRQALGALGVSASFARISGEGGGAGTWPDGTALLIVDLDASRLEPQAAIRLARGAGAAVLAYGAHTNTAAFDEARRGGADTVVARSAIAAGLTDLLEALLARRTGDAGRPSTPGVGPSTPGVGPSTPGVGPSTPGVGPSTPGVGPRKTAAIDDTKAATPTKSGQS